MMDNRYPSSSSFGGVKTIVLVILGFLCLCQNLRVGNCTGELIENFVRDAEGRTRLVSTPTHIVHFYDDGGENFRDGPSRPVGDENVPPKIIFENNYGSYHVSVRCLGKGVTSLSAIQCDSPVECKKQMSCFDDAKADNRSSCPKGKTIFRGEKCPVLKQGDKNDEDCFELEDRRWQLTSGLIECTTVTPDGAQGRREIQQFFKGTDQYFHLVQSNEFQMDLEVMEKMHEPILHIQYVGKPVFYTNKKVNVHCRATKFLFNSINIIGLRADGSHFQVDANSSLPGDEDKYWEQFYWEAYKPNMNVSSDLIGFTCTAQRYDSTEWTETTFQFTTAEPTKPVIDKTKKTRKIVWSSNENEHQSAACNYTGGPANVEIIRDKDGQDVVDRFLTAYELTRESKGLLQNFNYEQEGNYTCIVTNSMGNDSFQFYLDIPRSHATSKIVSSWSVGAALAVFSVLMVTIGNV